MKEFLEDVVDGLTDREAQTIRMRFGFDDGDPKSLQAIGEVLGVTRERVRQIEGNALKKLRCRKEVRTCLEVA